MVDPLGEGICSAGRRDALTLSGCCLWLFGFGVIARETPRRERREESESDGRREGARTTSALVLVSALPRA